MFRRTATAALAALTLAVTAGCGDGDAQPAGAPAPSGSPGPTGSPVAAGPPWYDEIAPAAAAVTIGEKAGPCRLPATFSMPAKWRAKAVRGGPDVKIGEAVPVCEIDAKPAGNIGFLRVWTIRRSGTPERTLDAFLNAYGAAAERDYRRTKVGVLDAYEASFSDADGNPERAALVSTIWGPLLLTLGGLDEEEHREMLPAYQLVKQTAKNNRDYE
ncbi:lipoprotein [Micromonospora auratinigra]|uniref:Lipoprotein n=1 Tax=Micromonospora auratinigra TaxID=261654 RepID=A0A1A8ZNT4_9ACTN|nr:lipoprotein [Micromonospora auratinigra]SBT45526.1 hypothetical protein GA0070611_3061 [Micromonospora auratinigra]